MQRHVTVGQVHIDPNRFGATLNAYVHLHLCMLDGVVAQGRQGLAFRAVRRQRAAASDSAGNFWHGAVDPVNLPM